MAYQVDSQVSFNELGNLCSLDSKTVEKYVVLLEKTYIISYLYLKVNRKQLLTQLVLGII